QGRIYMCLGQEDHVDLLAAFRAGGAEALDGLLDAALGAKPLRHDFAIGAGSAPATRRHMSVTGG
ncbi:MAG: cyclic pyranopterin phosphate synthase, partial [Sphingobium sp.]